MDVNIAQHTRVCLSCAWRFVAATLLSLGASILDILNRPCLIILCAQVYFQHVSEMFLKSLVSVKFLNFSFNFLYEPWLQGPWCRRDRCTCTLSTIAYVRRRSSGWWRRRRTIRSRCASSTRRPTTTGSGRSTSTTMRERSTSRRADWASRRYDVPSSSRRASIVSSCSARVTWKVRRIENNK